MGYPTSVWDGNSENRDRSLGAHKSPNYEDWATITRELIATQTKLDEVDVEIIIGTLTYGAGMMLVADGSSYEEVTVGGDVTLAANGAFTIGEGVVEDAMIEGLAAGQIILGVDGSAANNLITVLSGDVTMDGTGDVTIATGAVEDSMIEGLADMEIIIGVDGTAAANAKVTITGDVVVANDGGATIQTGAVEDSMIEGLAAGQIILGVDGDPLNNLIAVLSGDVTMDGTGDVTIAEGAVEDSMIEGLADMEIIIGVDGTAANNAKVTVTGDVVIANDGGATIQEGAVEDSMIQGLAAGQVILGVDGTAANNLITVLSGHVTMDGTGAVTLATVSKIYAVALSDLRCEDAAQTLLPAAPDGNGGTLGLGAAAGAPVLGSESNSGVQGTQREYAMTDFVVPADYVVGEDLTITVKCLVSDDRDTASPLVLVVKHIKAGGLDANDLMTSGSIDIKAQVTETANAFTVTGVGAGDALAPGDVLNVLIDVTTVDTAEAANGHVQINGVSVAVPSYR